MFGRAATALVFVLLSVAVGHADDACVFQRVVTLHSAPEANGHLMVPATLAGHPTHLLLDTAGGWSLIDVQLANALGLPVQTLQRSMGSLKDPAGNRIEHYITVPTMKLGDLAINRGMDFFIAPMAQGQSSEDFGGALGLNFLSIFDLEIDNARQLVTIFVPAPVATCGVSWSKNAVSFHYSLDNGVPVTSAVVDGEKVDAVIDTGSSRTILDIDFARRHFNLTPGAPGVVENGGLLMGGGEARSYSASVKTLSVSGIRFDNVPVELAEMDDVRVILGMNELRRLHLYFNFKGHTIYATPADEGLETQPPAPAAR